MTDLETTRAQLDRNLSSVHERIETARHRAHLKGTAPRIVAVTKYVEAEVARELFGLGLTDLGENRLRVAERKLGALSDLPIVWHWIGHLQTNKVRKALESFRVFHSVDRESVAEELDRQMEREGIEAPLPCFLQVNVAGEDAKYGVSLSAAPVLAEKLRACPHLDWVGLMTLAPLEEDPEKTRPVFAGLRELRDRLQASLGVYLPRLSMGMTNDFEIAVEEGATDLRLGSVLFEGLID